MIQSVNRALDIMLAVSDSKGKPLTISDISKITKLNPSTCCHIVDTLVERGFLNQVSRSQGYVLGVYSYTLTRYKDFHHDMIITCAPIINWLENKTGYTTLLANLIHGEKFVLSYAEAKDNQLKDRGELYKGTLYDTATGRAMLATMPDKEIRTIVSSVGLPAEDEWPGVDSYEKLLHELHKIADKKVVKVIIDSSGYICKFGIAFVTHKSERFAIGLDMKKDSKPDESEIKDIEKYLVIAANEIYRRLMFDNTER